MDSTLCHRENRLLCHSAHHAVLLSLLRRCIISKTLNIRSATVKEIKKAYYRLAKEHHPDTSKSHDDQKADHSAFQLIHEAMQTLVDPTRRAQYDMERHTAQRHEKVVTHKNRTHSTVPMRNQQRQRDMKQWQAHSQIARNFQLQRARAKGLRPEENVTSKTYDFESWHSAHYGVDREAAEAAQRAAYHREEELLLKRKRKSKYFTDNHVNDGYATLRGLSALVGMLGVMVCITAAGSKLVYL